MTIFLVQFLHYYTVFFLHQSLVYMVCTNKNIPSFKDNLNNYKLKNEHIFFSLSFLKVTKDYPDSGNIRKRSKENRC